MNLLTTRHIDSGTVEIEVEVRGLKLELSDEASGTDVTGQPEGWILFVDINGDYMTANEVREIADGMDEIARTSGRANRHDV